MAELSVAQRSGDTSRRSPGLLRRVSGWLLAVVAVLAGILAALVALFLAASISESRVLSLAVGALAGVGVAGGLGWLSVRVRKGPRARRRLLVGATCAALALALVAGVVWGVFLAPVPYDPYTAAASTSYWHLPTGSDIAYTRTATRVTHAEPVVLVHGGPGAPDEGFEPLAASLATAGFAVYTYQQLGAGQSGRLSDVRGYTVGRQVADLEAIRNQLGADKMILVGNSWGGTLTANYMAAHPTHVAKAVVASPGPIWYPAYPGNSDMSTGGVENQNATLARHLRFPIAVYLASIVGPRAHHPPGKGRRRAVPGICPRPQHERRLYSAAGGPRGDREPGTPARPGVLGRRDDDDRRAQDRRSPARAPQQHHAGAGDARAVRLPRVACHA